MSGHSDEKGGTTIVSTISPERPGRHSPEQLLRPADKRVYERLTRLVSAMLQVPVAVLLIRDGDVLRFGSFTGPELAWSGLDVFPLSDAFCQHALEPCAPFTVTDARRDPLVRDLLPTTDLGVVSYLGVPLVTGRGDAIGMLCAIDFEPREWSATDVSAVEDLAATVTAYIEARPESTPGSTGAGLNIAAVARRTGVAADTLRKWERRYGVLRPKRTAGGQRRYDELDVARVEWLRDRLAEGFRIGSAAALLEADRHGLPATLGELRGTLVTAARAGDSRRIGATLDQAFTLHPFGETIDEVVAPALAEVGDPWADGSGVIAHEHLLSETVRSRLERMLSDGRPGIRGTAVLACAPGERHDLGLLAVGVCLQSEGWLVAYLGADAPVESAFWLAAELEAEVVCVSFTTADSIERFRAELDAYSGELPTIVAGGPAVANGTDLPVRLLEDARLTAIGERLLAS